MDVNESAIELKVRFAGICGSDINKTYSGQIHEDNVEQFGHEVVCEYAGHLYVVNPFICMCNLEMCNLKSFMFCEECSRIGSGIANSGYSPSIMLNPKMRLDMIDDWIYPETGVLVDGAAVVFHLLHSINVKINHRLLIIGSGSLALLTALILRDVYPKVDIDIIVRSKEKRGLINEYYGNKLNVKDKEEVLGSNNLYDICIEAVGGNQTDSLYIALRKVKYDGSIYVLGSFDSNVKELHGIRELFYKQIKLIGINSYCNEHQDYQHAFVWIKENQLVIRHLITDVFLVNHTDLDQAEYKKKIIQCIKKEKTIKGVIKYE